MTDIHAATPMQLREHEAHKARIGRLFNNGPRPEKIPVKEIKALATPLVVPDFRAQVEAVVARVTVTYGPGCPQPTVDPLAWHEKPSRLRVAVIKSVVGRYYCVSQTDLVSECRTANVVRPRQIAMYLCCRMTTRGLAYIGSQFGDRDHSTVHHARNKITALRAANPDFDAELAELERKLTGVV